MGKLGNQWEQETHSAFAAEAAHSAGMDHYVRINLKERLKNRRLPA